MHGIGGDGEAGRICHRRAVHVRLHPSVLDLVRIVPEVERQRIAVPVVPVEGALGVVVVRHPAVARQCRRARARREVVAVDVLRQRRTCRDRRHARQTGYLFHWLSFPHLFEDKGQMTNDKGLRFHPLSSVFCPPSFFKRPSNIGGIISHFGVFPQAENRLYRMITERPPYRTTARSVTVPSAFARSSTPVT